MPDLGELKRHMVRGLFDSDGSVSMNSSSSVRLSFYGHPSYMEDLKKIFPVPFTVYNRKDKLGNIQVTRSEYVRTLYSYMYEGSTLYMKRKREVIEKCRGVL